MSRRKRIYRPSPFCSSEEYRAKMERYQRRFDLKTLKQAELAAGRSSEQLAAMAPSAQEVRMLAKFVEPQGEDPRIQALLDEAKRLNAIDPRLRNDPLELDHMWPLCQGGPHRWENVRLIQRGPNRQQHRRTREEIERIVQIEAANRGFTPWKLPDTFKEN